MEINAGRQRKPDQGSEIASVDERERLSLLSEGAMSNEAGGSVPVLHNVIIAHTMEPSR